jgi:hypothetical protein
MTADDFEDRYLEKGRELYEKGDKSELLNCLCLCIVTGTLLPDWLETALLDAYQLVQSRQVKSWDDVFDRPFKGKNARLVAARQKYLIAQQVWKTFVTEIVRGRPSTGSCSLPWDGNSVLAARLRKNFITKWPTRAS